MLQNRTCEKAEKAEFIESRAGAGSRGTWSQAINTFKVTTEIKAGNYSQPQKIVGQGAMACIYERKSLGEILGGK